MSPGCFFLLAFGISAWGMLGFVASNMNADRVIAACVEVQK